MFNKRLPFIILLALAIVIPSCKNDNNPSGPGGANVTFVGTIAGANESGVLTLQFSSSISKLFPSISASPESVVTLTGTLKIYGGILITLTGYFNTANDSIYISGGGYTFAGVLSGGRFTGGYSGPHGSGDFEAESSSSDNPSTYYCGSYHETSPTTTNTGVINVVIKGTSVTVLVTGGNVYHGTLDGNSITVYVSGTSGTVLAMGTRNPTTHTLSGTYNSGESQGYWSATECE